MENVVSVAKSTCRLPEDLSFVYLCFGFNFDTSVRAQLIRGAGLCHIGCVTKYCFTGQLQINGHFVNLYKTHHLINDALM